MNKIWQWVLGICVVLITLAVVATLVVPLFLPQTAVAGWGGMGPGHMFGGRGLDGFGGPMMGGGFGRSRMGGVFGIGMFLIPALVLGLIVLGVVWLVRAVSPARAAAPAPAAPAAVTAAPAPAATAPCAHCGQALQAEWKVCPYCGEKI